MKFIILPLIFLFLTKYNFAFELVAHRGIHQTYHYENLDNETCTATRIDNTGHRFLENTLESIEKSFQLGADIVEVDVHPTTELEGPDHLMVFHDWTLDCRTDASCENGCQCNEENQCITNEQSADFLKTLDLGYGYTYNNGATYPFRGDYIGLMPSFEDVLELLYKYPTQEILVNVKGNTDRTARAFIKIVKEYPLEIRSRLLYPYKYGHQTELTAFGVQDQIDQKDTACFLNYLLVGWTGHFPRECRNKRIFVPIRETAERFLGHVGAKVKFTSLIWGWPQKFIELAHNHGTKVYASQVDSEEEYNIMMKLDLDGIMTNKIEMIGPLYRSTNP